jgi:phage FluMu gp28-like protein
LVGDVTWTRGVIEMKNTPTPDQIREARALMPRLNRLVIDKGGMGLVIFEALEREFPGQVEGVQFSQGKKEAMAVMAKRRMEEQKVRLPDSNPVRQSFRSVKKSVNALGLTRFDAEHDARFGHADHWWAFCLAEAAAARPAAYHLAEVGRLFGTPVISGVRDWVF